MHEKEEQALMQKLHKVIIIGSGPAGYTAALYTSRANLNPLVFTGMDPGGQLMITTEVENYPGFPQGVMGPEMMELFKQQAEKFGTTVIQNLVTKVDFSERPFKIWVNDDIYHAESLIISTGATAKWLGLESEKTFGGYGVSACATCDGFFFKNKEVVIVGGGDTAMEEATFLTKFCKRVYIVHRRDTFRASKIMQEKVFANDKIQVIWNAVVEDILGELEPKKRVTGIRLKHTLSSEESEMPIDGVFMAIGYTPNTQVFKDHLLMDDQGYITVEPYSTKTSIPGIFAAGDVADKVYKQAITAAGMGCMAAIDAEKFIEDEEYRLKAVI